MPDAPAPKPDPPGSRFVGEWEDLEVTHPFTPDQVAEIKKALDDRMPPEGDHPGA